MKIVLVSNFLNHHQLPLCKAFEKFTDGNFHFIATSATYEEQLNLGYDDMNKKYPFVITAYDSTDGYSHAKKRILEADAVIVGSASDDFIKDRLKQNKLIFRYSERLYKKRCSPLIVLYHILKYYPKFNLHKNQYLLCASAYAAVDYSKLFSFRSRAYKWGYFPEAKEHTIDSVIECKKPHSILWVGRFVDWKRPEVCVELAKRIIAGGNKDFRIDMIGTGTMLGQIKDMIAKNQLEDYVAVLGSMKPEEVRRHMEESEVFIFSSDQNEGWGAVLNEAMNSGCAVVASHAIGAVPYLMKHNENGLIYKSRDIDALYQNVKYLLDHPDEQHRLGEAAYRTITEEWNAEIAAERIVVLAQHILDGEKYPDLYESGPCSKAEIIKDNWFENADKKILEQ